jgi:hypothetical protein
MKIIRLLAIAAVAAIVASSAQAFTLSGSVNSGACKVEGAQVELFDVNQLPGGIYKTRHLATAVTSSAGKFKATFLWSVVSGPPAPPSWESGGPDVIVRVTQKVDGTTNVVLNEAPSAARWNLASGATLALTGSAMCQSSGAPGDANFVFTRIGRIPTAEIDCRGDVASSGYAHHATTTAVNGDYTNQPFGGTMDVFGFFGTAAGVNRYKLEYSVDGGATYTEYSDPLWDYYYDPPTHTWISESMGPATVKGVQNLYKLAYIEKPNAWSWLNRLAVFDTRKAADGIVRFRARGYSWNEATNTLTPDPPTLTIDSAYGAIRLLVDNTAPVYSINKVLRNGVEIEPCAFVNLGAADALEVRFTARDANGHLGRYSLNAHYGHAQVVSPTPIAPDKAVDGYANHVSAALTWTNPAEYRIQYQGYSTAAMPTCAYQLRLKVTKRTTDGYDLIYHDLEDNWHLAIQR